MKKNLNFLYTTWLLSLLTFPIHAQITNYIYGLNNASPGVFYFSKIEIATGAITNFQTAATALGSNYSSCINNLAHEYYLCKGNTLSTFDPVTGNLLSSTVLPIPPTADFLHIRFNPCDLKIYGIINDYPTSISFAKYDPDSATMSIISSLNSNTSFCMGCMSFLDADSGIFAFQNGNLIGLDIYSGQIRYDNPVLNLPNEIFGHIALKCSTHEIFGTSANVNAGVKYLSTIDPYTGQITHVSNTSWNVGIFKPASGGDCINQSSGNYYYSGSGHMLIGANTISGNMVYNQVINSGELFFIEHFSDCKCTPTGFVEEKNGRNEGVICSNPFDENLIVSAITEGDYEITLFDITSRQTLQQNFTQNISINTELLENGIYIYILKNKNKTIQSGKVIKQ